MNTELIYSVTSIQEYEDIRPCHGQELYPVAKYCKRVKRVSVVKCYFGRKDIRYIWVLRCQIIEHSGISLPTNGCIHAHGSLKSFCFCILRASESYFLVNYKLSRFLIFVFDEIDVIASIVFFFFWL